MKIYKIYAAFLGLTAIILGALGAHLLKNILTAEQLHSFETAVKYQMYMAIALLWITHSNLPSKKIILLWSLGVTFFSGSIYGLIFLQWKFLGPITPLGGVMMIIGWGLLLQKFIKQ